MPDQEHIEAAVLAFVNAPDAAALLRILEAEQVLLLIQLRMRCWSIC